MPQHHKDMLDKRAKMIKEGKADLLDWEDAKNRLKKLFNDHQNTGPCQG